jgi:hypothetical protein
MTTAATPRIAGRALALAAALATLLVLAGPAVAGSSCGRAVINDWSDGRIDKTYPLRCYGEAIAMLPRDIRDYSSAEDDMRRALQAARRGQEAPPNRDSDPSPPVETSPTPTAPPEASDPSDDPGETETQTDTTGAPGPDDEDPSDDEEAVPPVDTENASSVPIPLLILAGLALLLVLGGSAGYLIRRLQARRLPTRAT